MRKTSQTPCKSSVMSNARSEARIGQMRPKDSASSRASISMVLNEKTQMEARNSHNETSIEMEAAAHQEMDQRLTLLTVMKTQTKTSPISTSNSSSHLNLLHSSIQDLWNHKAQKRNIKRRKNDRAEKRVKIWILMSKRILTTWKTLTASCNTNTRSSASMQCSV